tara:strand:- start:1175 stop:1756 length:582 start_codon:yes stop_codon:yes gene_type:complete
MEFILVRHAQSMHNALKTDDLNSTLTSEGLSQAEAVGRYLRENYNLDNFQKRVSPYLRCIQTASFISPTGFTVDLGAMEVACLYTEDSIVPLAKYNNIELTNNAQFNYNAFGEYDGVDHKYETLKEFLARMEEYVASFEEGSHLVVAHGGVVCTMANIIAKRPHGKWGECLNASISHFIDDKEVCYSKVIYEQ